MITLDNNRLKYLLSKIINWVNDRIRGSESNLNYSISRKIDKPITVTYLELKDLVRTSSLNPGQQYIISNYATTTYQPGTKFKTDTPWGSLIVTAVSSSELNPEAFYNGCKVWYCLENDTDRFAWIKDDSDTFETYEFAGFVPDAIIPTEDDPVISEFSYHYPVDNPNKDNSRWFTIFNSESEDIEDPLHNSILKKVDYYIAEYEGGNKYYFAGERIINDIEYQEWHGDCVIWTKKFVNLTKRELTIDYSTGVIYRMIDEYGNDVPYDFKNILLESNELELNYTLVNDTSVYDVYSFSGPHSTYWYEIQYPGDGWSRWAIKDENGQWLVVKGIGSFTPEPDWTLIESIKPKKYSTFYNGNNSNQTTDCSHLVRNCSIAPAVVDGVQVINNIRIDVSETPLINIDQNCTNLNISGDGDITIHSGVSGTKENPIELFLSGSPHVYYEDNQVIVRSEKQLADDISNLQEDVRAIKVRDYFYESDDPEYGRKIFIYPKSSGDKESKYEILSLSSKGLPLEQDYVTVESINSSFGNIISASQGTALYQTGGEPSKSSELYYGYDRINLIKNQIERYCKVIPIKEFINAIPAKDSDGKTSFSWAGSSGNGRLSIRISSVLEAYPEFYIEGTNKVTYKLCDLEPANSSLSFSKISGTNIAIDGFKSIEGQSFSKYANCIDYLNTQDFNIVMKLINPVIQPVEAEGLSIDNTSFTREKNTTEWIDFSGGCVELAYLSTSDYIYSKDQIDNKFYTQTYINNNFLKNSENIYIDGLDEFKDEEEEISLQDVLRKINSKDSVNIDSIEDKAIPYSKLADDVTESIVATITDSAPETLNNLNELAAALGDDPNFAVTMTTELGKKVDKVTGKGLSTNDFTDELKRKLENDSVTKYAYLMPNNGFSSDSNFGISYLNNPLYSASDRFVVETSGFTGGVAQLFDGNYEGGLQLAQGQTGILTISNNGDNIIDGYPYGDIILSFYYENVPESISVEVYCNYESHGIGWKTLDLKSIEGGQKGIYKFTNGFYNITQVKITIIAKENISTSLVEIDWQLNRSKLSNYPVVTKYNLDQELFGHYVFKNAITIGDKKITSIANVAISGSYDDLTNKPTIPSAVTESTVSGWGFTKNSGTYSKPSGGIPKTDLANEIQTSLGKADSALQSIPSTYATKTDVNNAIAEAITTTLNTEV